MITSNRSNRDCLSAWIRVWSVMTETWSSALTLIWLRRSKNSVLEFLFYKLQRILERLSHTCVSLGQDVSIISAPTVDRASHSYRSRLDRFGAVILDTLLGAFTFLSFPSFKIIFLLFPFWIHIITNSNNHFFFKLFNVFFFRIQRNQGLQPTFMVLKKSNFDPGLGSKFFDEFFDIGQNSSHKFWLLWYNVLLLVPIVIQSPLPHKYDPNNYFQRFDSDSHVINCSILI